MEGDILAAQERDRKMKNRAKRKVTFLKKQWKVTRTGGYFLKYHEKYLFINYNGRYYCCTCDNRRVWKYRGKPIDNFISACHAIFDLVDPIEEAME